MTKKITVFITILCLSFLSLQAQVNELAPKQKTDKLMMGIKLGLNFSNYTKGDFDFRPCVNTGLMLDIPLKKNWSIMPGAMLSTKGARNSVEKFWYNAQMSNGQTYDYYADEKYFFSPLYIDIPVLASYKLRLDPYSHLYFAAGPYVSFAVGGHMKREFTGDVEKVSLYKLDKNFDLGYKRLNAGLDFEFGYYYEGWQFSVGYDWGLTKVTDQTQKIKYTYKGTTNEMNLVVDGMKHYVIRAAIAFFFNL